MDMCYTNGDINNIKIKVKIASIGTVDMCDHCKTEYTKGVACWTEDPDMVSLDLCNICLDKYYIRVY